MEDGTPQIKVKNTKLGIETSWSLDKFESRLEQMRDIYYASEQVGGTNLPFAIVTDRFRTEKLV